MKVRIKTLVFCSSIAALVSLDGCREITTTTRIFPDGSLERTVAVKDDSTAVDSVFTGPFPFPVDSSWTVTQARAKKNEKGYVTTAVKRFAKAVDLNERYKSMREDSLKVAVEIRLDRKFRWFNTFYQYQETVKPAGLFINVPIGEFMTPKELTLYYIKEDTLHLDKKVDQWLIKGVSEDIFKVLLRASETMPVKGLTPKVIRAGKDSLFAAFKRADPDKMDDGAKLTAFLAKFYKNKAVTRWRGPMDEAMKSMQKKQEFFLSLDTDSYANEIIMPGLILDTNASTVEGNKAVWKFKGNRLFWENYVMRVESRVVNTWAIWTTAGLLLAGLAGLLVASIRRK